jgi:hypothetical protein
MLPVVIFKESFLVRETQSVIHFKSLFYAGYSASLLKFLSYQLKIQHYNFLHIAVILLQVQEPHLPLLMFSSPQCTLSAQERQ